MLLNAIQSHISFVVDGSMLAILTVIGLTVLCQYKLGYIVDAEKLLELSH